MSPEYEERVLEEEINKAERSFDEIRSAVQPIDQERHDKLLSTARRAIREKNFDTARRSVDEMLGIQLKALMDTPEFLYDMLRMLADERHLAIDTTLHEQHCEAGRRAAQSEDVGEMRFVIGQMMNNRVSTGTNAANIVELAHLLGR